jgi:phenylalanyl-tRNA synthetase beta chain
MGGENSEINDETVDVVLESANWNPSSIRRTSKALGIISDASQRFERGADPNGVMFALNRAAQLVVQLAGGTLLKGAIDVYPRKTREREVPLRPERVNAVLGTSLTKDQVIRYLRLLDMTPVRRKGKTLRFRIPSYRIDIEREIDMIEEVARVHGYNNIEEKTTATVDFVHPFPKTWITDRVRDYAIGNGYREVITNAMQDVTRSSLGGGEPVKILNPQNQDMATLRTSLVPGLMDVVARNFNFGTSDLRLFEVGHVFRVDSSEIKKLVGNFLEEERVCFLLTGTSGPQHWSGQPRQLDFFDLKGEVEDFLRKFALDKCRFISYSTSNGLTDNTLAIEIHGSYAGYIGSVTKGVREKFGVEQDVFVAEFSMSSLAAGEKAKFEPLPRYPKVRRDVAFLLDATTPAEDCVRVIREGSNELLRGVEVFDVYQGDKLPAGKKSMAFSLELMSDQRTLTEAEIDAAVQGIVRTVEQRLGATLRSVK